MNDILRIARLGIALQRAFLGRAILRVEKSIVVGHLLAWHNNVDSERQDMKSYSLSPSLPSKVRVLRRYGYKRQII